MKRSEFSEWCRAGVRLLDGATGTNLMRAGMPRGVCLGAMGAGASADDPETPAGICRGGQRGALCADLLRQPLCAEGLRSGGAAAHDERVARAAHTKGGGRGRTGRRGYDDAGPSGRGGRRTLLSGAASGLPGAGGGPGGRRRRSVRRGDDDGRDGEHGGGRGHPQRLRPADPLHALGPVRREGILRRKRRRGGGLWRSLARMRSASTAPPGRISWKAWCG